MLEIVQLKEGPHSHAGVAFSDRCRNNGVSVKRGFVVFPNENSNERILRGNHLFHFVDKSLDSRAPWYEAGSSH